MREPDYPGRICKDLCVVARRLQRLLDIAPDKMLRSKKLKLLKEASEQLKATKESLGKLRY